jgi:hypothetical protein
MTCPRCRRPLIRNHDELLCLTHGQIEQPVQAWETAPDVATASSGRRATHQEYTVPWTDEEREQWRRAEAGEDVPDERPRKPTCVRLCKFCGHTFVDLVRQVPYRYCPEHRGNKWRELARRNAMRGVA